MEREAREKEEDERINKLAEERIKRFDVERQKSQQILEKTKVLEKELVDLIATMERQLQQVIPKNVLTQSNYNMIINNAPFVPPATPNEIQPEIKTIYATINKNIHDLRSNNSKLQIYKDYAPPAADITAFNNDLMEIINLNDTLINTTIPQFQIDKESCKSFVAFMEKPKTWNYNSIKISNNREFYVVSRL